jgi:hypothetical protein
VGASTATGGGTSATLDFFFFLDRAAGSGTLSAKTAVGASAATGGGTSAALDFFFFLDCAAGSGTASAATAWAASAAMGGAGQQHRTYFSWSAFSLRALLGVGQHYPEQRGARYLTSFSFF